MVQTDTVKTINWKLIDLSDREIFENTGSNHDGIAMFGFCSLFFWKDYYKTAYAVINGNIVARGLSDNGDAVIYFPRGLNNNVKETIDTIIESSETRPVFMPLTEECAEKIAKEFKNAEIKQLDGKCEYVYDQSDLSNLAGKKYHAKRNHIAKFDKNYDCEYININGENISVLKDCAEYLFEIIENSPKDEFQAILCAIRYFEDLNLRAGVIKVDGKFVAYSIGSVINSEIADIHFEKADRSYDGSYAKINNCFAKYGWNDMKYLNREEDLGIEGLRKAKLSYHPSRLNLMYSVKL